MSKAQAQAGDRVSAGSHRRPSVGTAPPSDPSALLEKSRGAPIRFAFGHRWYRKVLLAFLERRLERLLMREVGIPYTVRRERRILGKAIMRSVGRFLDEVQHKPTIREALKRRVLPALLQASLSQGQAQVRFRERFDVGPPGLSGHKPHGGLQPALHGLLRQLR